MRIAVGSYQASDGQTIPVHSVAVTVSNDGGKMGAQFVAESSATQHLLNDPAFKAAVMNGIKIVAQDFLQELIPHSTDVFNQNQYVAIVTDVASLPSLKKGDRISLVEQLNNVTAEVVEILSSTMPPNRTVKIVTTVFKVSAPLVAAALRFKNENIHKSTIEHAVLQAHSSLLSDGFSQEPLMSLGVPQINFYHPNPEVRKLFVQKLDAINRMMDRET